MKNDNKALNILRRFFLTILFPLAIFLVMLIITRSKGVSYFGFTWEMWRTVLVEKSLSLI